MSATRVAVLGAGAWGTTLANLLAQLGNEVMLWAYEEEVAGEIARHHVNPWYLPGCPLEPSLGASSDSAAVVEGREVVVAVTPSHVARTVLGGVESAVAADALVVVASKGIENGTLSLIHAVASESLPGRRMAVLSGPSFAKEVYGGQPTAVVAAAQEAEAAEATQRLFSGNHFRVYTNDDVIGVELGGSLKNVIAIAAGILEGLGLGSNPRAALLTRGLAEITRLGMALGANPLTFAGLAGVGDMILTATGPLSRNRSLGEALARGVSLEEYREEHRTVAEGVNTARAAMELAARHGVELPITQQVAQILFEGKAPRDAIGELMGRDPKPEQWQ